jgi:agmatinase
MAYPAWEELRDSLWLRGRNFPYLAADTPTFMGCPHATSAGDLEGANVVIIGSPYVTSWTDEYAGVAKVEWVEAPKRVRQQSVRYPSAYIEDFDLDVFDHLTMVDFGDAAIPPEAASSQTVDVILRSQAAVEEKVNAALDAGALPIVIGQNSPCASYAIAKCVSEHARGDVGVVSLDTHWDIEHIDTVTMDPRIAGASSWLHKTLELQRNIHPRNLVEVGPRGMLEDKTVLRALRAAGAHFYSSWDVRQLGIETVCEKLDAAYDGTIAVYAHFDMDVIGGAGPASGDILGELAEPIGLSDYEVIRIAHEIGRRGCAGFSFICIPPGSPVVYRLIVYVIMYLLAGRVLAAAS